MVTWTLECNACDVLGLGPRAAGRLATVGVRTVKELLSAKPRAAADKQFTAGTIAAWQREARLLVSIPELTSDAARILAAVEVASAARLSRSSPTDLISKIEALWGTDGHSWLASKSKPTTAEICQWIRLAQHRTQTQDKMEYAA